MATLKITKSNFQKEVIESTKPVLLDFFASWCGPCKSISPIIDEISDECPQIKVCKADIDEEPDLASEYDIMSVPTLMIIKDGKIANQSSGAKSKNEIMAMLKEQLVSPGRTSNGKDI